MSAREGRKSSTEGLDLAPRFTHDAATMCDAHPRARVRAREAMTGLRLIEICLVDRRRLMYYVAGLSRSGSVEHLLVRQAI